MKKVVVFQIGARMNYAVPRITSNHYQLVRFYTDYSADGSGSFASRGNAFSVWLFRQMSRLTPSSTVRKSGVSQIKDFKLSGLTYVILLRIFRGTVFTEYIQHYFSCGLTARVASDLSSSRVVCDLLYCFNSAALEIFKAQRGDNTVTVLEQTIAPKIVEYEKLADVRDENWLSQRLRKFITERQAKREIEEFSLADIIICPSDFVRRSLIKVGVEEERIKVVPYGVRALEADDVLKPEAESGLPVLKDPEILSLVFVGGISYRKGVDLLLDVVDTLEPGQLKIHFFGTIVDSPLEGRLLRSRNSSYHGKVDNKLVRRFVTMCDALVLPSRCEGSATVIYEALSAGVPVYVSHESGAPCSGHQCVTEFDSLDIDDIKRTLVALARRKNASESPRVSAEVRSYVSLHGYEGRLLEALNTLTPLNSKRTNINSREL